MTEGMTLPRRHDLIDDVYKMLQQVGVLLDDGDRRALRTAGLTPTQYNLLNLIDEPSAVADGGPSIIRLSERLLCTRGNVTRLVQRLVESGLVLTRTDPRDQRLVKVYLTKKGRGRLSAAHELHVRANRERFGDISESDLRRLHELVATLVEVFDKHLR